MGKLSLLPNLQEGGGGGVGGVSVFRAGLLGKRGGTFLGGGGVWSFYIKNKLKWEILTKTLV